MSTLTIGGQLRQLLVETGLFGARSWADRAPDGATFPYTTYHDAISTNPALRGDGNTIMLTRACQVDLWQSAKEEDAAVDRAVYNALNGAKIVVAGATIMRVAVEDTQRIFEPETYIAHRFFTLNVRHDTSAF